MEGFTLKCNRCGRELKLKGNNFYSIQADKQYHNKLFLGIDWHYEEVKIKCECGNEVSD